MQTTAVIVSIPGHQDYVVRIGAGIRRGLGEQMRKCPAVERAPKVLVITDANVERLYLADVMDSLKRASYTAASIVVDAGEETKAVDVAHEIWDAMADLGLTRDCAVVALGGGVVGDLAGFCASTFMRGIPVVQAPTTLLSMVDSSVGGKTAINLDAGKNLVGTFFQPAFVCADVDVLSTLDEREWTCGLAEAAKIAVIDSDDFFFWLTEHADAAFARDPEVVAEIVSRCVVFKANVVAQDECESKGVRECLNYGHTLAHAIEVLSGYGTHSHGAAVAEGMRFAGFLAQERLGSDPALIDAQGALLDSLGLPPLGWTAAAEDVLSAMKRDKKARGGEVRFVLLEDVGDWAVCEVDDAALIDALERYLAAEREGGAA